MIDAAFGSGVDAIKFQTFQTDKLVSKDAPKAEYQTRSTSPGDGQYSMLKRLELDFEAHLRLKERCVELGILFLSTPFDNASVDLLERVGVPLYKVPSGEINNPLLLRKIASTGKPVILSTGMASLEEIHSAIAVLSAGGTTEITVLHCNTEYPTPFIDVNLRAIGTMREALGVEIGYSDHTEGIEIPIAAVALGARVIEKHFTLDRAMEGPDHKASLEPDELKAMVTAIRHIEMAMGDGIKKASPSEQKNIMIARKSIVATRLIRQGERFNDNNLTVKRPGGGIDPMRWDEVLGQLAQRDFEMDEQIEI